ncbi:MAG TPA: hypothetical protein VMM13_11220, partial [Euzebya sp.]|nr:hypothetical protein [Euzebya sp.]
TVTFGAPIIPRPDEDAGQLMARAWEAVGHLTEHAARTYPYRPHGEADSWWVPVHLGGGAPTVQESLQIRAAEAASRRQRRETELSADGRCGAA